MAAREGCVVVREGCVVAREGCVVVREGCVVVREGCVATREGPQSMGARRERILSVLGRVSVSAGGRAALSLPALSLSAASLAAALTAPAALAQDARLPNPGMAWVIFGADTVVAEVAGTPEQREKGLMDRDAVPDGTGMLFVFRRSEERYLWMRNTYVPLDAAFFDDDNRIGVIRQMEPLDETLVDSEIATRLVLEVRQGWFAENGIEVGAEAEVVFGPGIVVR